MFDERKLLKKKDIYLTFKTPLHSLEIPDVKYDKVPVRRSPGLSTDRSSGLLKKKGAAELYRDLFGNNRYNKWIRKRSHN